MSAPRRDETRGANAGQVGTEQSSSRPDRAAAGAAEQAPAAVHGAGAGPALQVIAGERKAQEYLERLRTDRAAPDELALAVAPLYGGELRGFCSVLAKQLRSERHA